MSRPKVLALILAGGEGGRLEVLTEKRAKPVMPYAGTYRLIDIALSNCKHSRISDVWIIEQYQPHSLNEHLANGRPWDLDRTYGGLQVLPPYISKDDEGGFARGNADAIYRHRNFIREFQPDIVLVLSADHVYKLDYRDVIAQHREREADVTMVTTRVSLEEASRFGTVRVDARGRVTDFAYKPETPQSDTVTTEVFVYDARTLLETLDSLVGERAAGEGGGDANAGQDSDDSATLKDFGHELLPRLVREGRAYEYRHHGYWRDVGTVDSYWQSHMDLLSDEPELTLDDPRWPILTFGAQRLPARIHGSAQIENSLISPGCTVRGRVLRSVLAPGVIVEEDAIVCDSILLHETRVRSRAVVNCAILDRDVTVGAEALIGRQVTTDDLPGAAMAHRSEGLDIAVIGEGTDIAAGSRIAPGARLKPEMSAVPHRRGAER